MLQGREEKEKKKKKGLVLDHNSFIPCTATDDTLKDK